MKSITYDRDVCAALEPGAGGGRVPRGPGPEGWWGSPGLGAARGENKKNPPRRARDQKPLIKPVAS